MRTAGGRICRISSWDETPDNKISLKTKRKRGQGKKQTKTSAKILMNLISSVNKNLVHTF